LGYFAKVTHELLGKRIALPREVTAAWPELNELTYRRGGLPLRVGGILLGQTTVAAITLGRTIFLARDTSLNPELLLHELRHVQQFAERKTFPLHYIWESLRRGYHANRFEVDARDFAARRVARNSVTDSEEDA
jgi:hypothetical protein